MRPSPMQRPVNPAIQRLRASAPASASLPAPTLPSSVSTTAARGCATVRRRRAISTRLVATNVWCVIRRQQACALRMRRARFPPVRPSSIRPVMASRPASIGGSRQRGRPRKLTPSAQDRTQLGCRSAPDSSAHSPALARTASAIYSPLAACGLSSAAAGARFRCICFTRSSRDRRTSALTERPFATGYGSRRADALSDRAGTGCCPCGRSGCSKHSVDPHSIFMNKDVFGVVGIYSPLGSTSPHASTRSSCPLAIGSSSIKS
jgi:hypothetical protein